MTINQKRRILSFVRREGKITPGQKRALDELWPIYGLSCENSVLNISSVFTRDAPTILEIGFGNGDSLLEQAKVHPEQNFIGIEVHRPGVGRLLANLHHAQIKNIRIICADAVEVIRHCVADNVLDGVQIFFPDPWHKFRHHKRRLIQTNFIELLTPKLKLGGKLHLATDWEDYAKQMLSVMSANSHFINAAGAQQYTPRPSDRPLTKFEKRGTKLGHQVWDLVFIKTSGIKNEL